MTFAIGNAGNFTTLYFAGHMRTDDETDNFVFAGISLAVMFNNIVSLSILAGLSTAVETLGSQLNGAQEYHKVGILLYRSIAVLSISLVPISLIYFNATAIFGLAGIDSRICVVVQSYLQIRALALPADVIVISYEKYLISLGVMEPAMYVSIVYNIMLVAMNILFVHVLQWDVEGLAWAVLLCTYVEIAVLVLFSVSRASVRRTLCMPSFEALADLGQFFHLGMPGLMTTCAEWWAYECLTIMATRIGPDSVSAEVIIMSVFSILATIPVAISSTTAAMVGNSIGAGRIDQAKRIGELCIFTTALLEVAVCLLILVTGTSFMDVYASNSHIRAICKHAYWIIPLGSALDAISTVAGGVLRGTGKQGIAAVTNFIAFYVFGIPCAWLWGLHYGFGLNGLLIGVGMGTLFQFIVVLAVVLVRHDQVYTSAVHLTDQ
jgi:multidrug resistance protein, MATE family